MKEYLEETEMLNYNAPEITELSSMKGWKKMDKFHKIQSVYEFVQNDILFGYNSSDLLNAVQVLDDGFGQCNTKATLLMALLRSVHIPCRLHAFDVTKYFQRGATSGFISLLAPEYILHTWAEVFYEKRWIALEGVITDKKYLNAVQRKFPDQKGIFKKYAIAVTDLKNPPVDWTGQDTFIQKEAIAYDYGTFPSPDSFFSEHKQRMSGIKDLLYSQIGRRIMTGNVQKIREGR